VTGWWDDLASKISDGLATSPCLGVFSTTKVPLGVDELWSRLHNLDMTLILGELAPTMVTADTDGRGHMLAYPEWEAHEVVTGIAEEASRMVMKAEGKPVPVVVEDTVLRVHQVAPSPGNHDECLWTILLSAQLQPGGVMEFQRAATEALELFMERALSFLSAVTPSHAWFRGKLECPVEVLWSRMQCLDSTAMFGQGVQCQVHDTYDERETHDGRNVWHEKLEWKSQRAMQMRWHLVSGGGGLPVIDDTASIVMRASSIAPARSLWSVDVVGVLTEGQTTEDLQAAVTARYTALAKLTNEVVAKAL